METNPIHNAGISLSPSGPVVGKAYDVPCVRIVGDTVFPNEFLKIGELVPVLLPAHDDAEYFDFPYLHFHIDFRFVNDDLWERMHACTAHIHACIITTSLVAEGPQQHSLNCLRKMPVFPTAAEIKTSDAGYEGLTDAVRGLESHYRNSRINTSTLICPHRGVCLTGLPTTDGIVVCPAHGLAWNITTGELVCRHNKAQLLAELV